MDEYRIVHQANPPQWAISRFCQRGFLFHDYEQLLLQNNGCFYLVSALNLTTQQTEARCAFFLCLDKAFSPMAAPFGSIEFIETLPEHILDDVISSLLYKARLMGANQIWLTNYPTCYAPVETQQLTKKLLAHGFVLTENHPTHFLPVTNVSFVQAVAPAQRRRLRKCERAGFLVAYEPYPDVDQVMAFLHQTRQHKGYPLTINLDKLANLVHRFPDHYPVFTVKDKHALIALTIAVRVRHDILYSFLPASHPAYQTYSPMVLLTDGLYQYCQQQRISLLDLGVSLDHHRQPKPSLMRFKRNLGALESPKLAFRKML